MTIEEIIDGLETYTVGRPNKDIVNITVEELQKFIDGIKSLEQESSETIQGSTYDGVSWGGTYKLQQLSDDCISRRYLLNNCVVDMVTFPYVPINRIQEAPPVTPQESKKGHWIFKDADDRACLVYTCDKCEEQITLFDDTLKNPQEGHYNFCPNCGCMMKSEDQE